MCPQLHIQLSQRRLKYCRLVLFLLKPAQHSIDLPAQSICFKAALLLSLIIISTTPRCKVRPRVADESLVLLYTTGLCRFLRISAHNACEQQRQQKNLITIALYFISYSFYRLRQFGQGNTTS
jgi:hypothetical protein